MNIYIYLHRLNYIVFTSIEMPNIVHVRFQKRKLRWLKYLCLQIKRELCRLRISVNSMQLHQFLSQIIDGDIPDIAFNPNLVEQIRTTVTQCAERSNASEHSIIEFLSGATAEQKLIHLMDCSCQCRQLWRLALKEWTEVPDSTPYPQPPACRCCLRHQQCARGGIRRH